MTLYPTIDTYPLPEGCRVLYIEAPCKGGFYKLARVLSLTHLESLRLNDGKLMWYYHDDLHNRLHIANPPESEMEVKVTIAKEEVI